MHFAGLAHRLFDPQCHLSTWNSVTEKVRGFMIFFLLLETGMLGVFLARGYGALPTSSGVHPYPEYFIISVCGVGTPPVCGHQVRALHPDRVAGHAGRILWLAGTPVLST
jgi:hypothetical protein